MSVADTLGYSSFPIPVGTIFFYAGLGIPDTYLDCQGNAFDPLEYPLLAQVLGVAVTPALGNDILGGGPLAQIGQLQPATSGAITPAPITLIAANIPTLNPFDVIGSVQGNWITEAFTPQSSGTGIEVLNVAGPNQTSIDRIFDYTIQGVNTLTTTSAPTPAPVFTEANLPITPTVTGSGDTTPTTLTLRYIIKAKY